MMFIKKFFLFRSHRLRIRKLSDLVGILCIFLLSIPGGSLIVFLQLMVLG